eukprot:7391471-Prymnesium_polylepis.2
MKDTLGALCRAASCPSLLLSSRQVFQLQVAIEIREQRRPCLDAPDIGFIALAPSTLILDVAMAVGAIINDDRAEG